MTYPDLSNVKRVLVAKLRHHGDVLLSSPLFTSLKEAMPEAQIDAYIYKETHPMLEGHSAISNFILYDKAWKKLSSFKRFLHEISVLRQIKKGRYDLVINLTEGDRGAIAAKTSKAAVCVGADPKGSGMKGKAKIYSHLIKHGHNPRHTVEKDLDALRVIGIFPKEEKRELSFHIPDDICLEEYRGATIIHPVSRWMFKCIPAKKMASIITYLQMRGDRVVLTSSPDENEIAYIRAVQSHVDVEDVAGTLTLKELGAVIRDAKLLITVDSLPLHLSSVFKTPVVALFGPTSELTWGPWRNPHARVVTKVISCRPCYKPGCGSCGVSDCLETLSVDEIIQSVNSLPK